MRAIVRAFLLALAFVGFLASPAFADAAKPSNDQSLVTGIDPAITGVQAQIIGPDSFLGLTVRAGVTVDIGGYDGEPYIRFAADGTVSENLKSPAHYLNAKRFGAPVPAGVTSTATPEWHQVASGGAYAWHDHRVHNMGGPVQRSWEVPVTIDGAAHTIRGTLTRFPAPSALPWELVLVSVGALVATFGWRRGRLVGLAAVGAAVLAAWIAFEIHRALDVAHQAGWGLIGLAAVAVVAAAVAVAARVSTPTRSAVLTGAGVALALWAWQQRQVVNHAFGLSDLDPWIERFVVAIAGGAGIGAVVVGVGLAIYGGRPVEPTPPDTAPSN